MRRAVRHLAPLLFFVVACSQGAGGGGNGVPPGLGPDEVLARIRGQLDESAAARRAVRGELFGLDSDGGVLPASLTDLAWDPSHDSVYFTSTSLGSHVPLLVSNDAAKATGSDRVVLAIAGLQLTSRYAALASNPLSDLARTPPAPGSAEERMIRFDERLVRWLVGDPQATLAGERVVLAHLADSYWFRHDEGTPAFFASSFPSATVNVEDACDNRALRACLAGASLLVLGADDGGDDADVAGAFDADAVADALDEALRLRIPILFVANDGGVTAMSELLLARFGLETSDNYWRQERIVAFSPTELATAPDDLAGIAALTDTLLGGSFTVADYASCIGVASNFDGCAATSYRAKLGQGLDALDAAFDAYAARGVDPFSPGGPEILQLFAWLGDLYRVGSGDLAPLRYPVDIAADPAGVARALVADATVCLTCSGLRAQPDLGTYVCDRDDVRAGTCTPYDPRTVPRRTLAIREPFRTGDEWTSTGAYALAGVPFTVRRSDAVTGRVFARIGFARGGTTRSLQSSSGISNYDRPHDLTSPWVELEAGRDVTLTSPYGGPIYVRLAGDGSQTGQIALVELEGVGRHAALLDVGDGAAVDAFVADVQANPLPHVDLRAPGFEAHLRKDRFLSTALGSADVADTATGETLVRSYAGDVARLVADYRDHYVGSVYALAGLPRPGLTLDATLSQDVRDVCANLGLACSDPALHRVRSTQHANYDEYAACGSGCSGNPWDASWSIEPLGWGEAHELGHNLQRSELDVGYVPSGSEDRWDLYERRAGENSNNIFPYFVKFRFLRRIENDSRAFVDSHMNHEDVFAAVQSARAGIVRDVSGVSRSVVFDHSCGVLADVDPAIPDPHAEAIWADPAYAARNGLRMSFYLQLPLRLEGTSLPGGTVLQDGFDIFPLLYALAREFAQAGRDDASWTAARDRLGFGLFPRTGHAVYGAGDVRDIPGNDFLLVALAQLTGADFRPHFAIHGVRTSSLARAQVDALVSSGHVTRTVADAFYALATGFPSADLEATPTVAVDGVASFPLDGFHPSSCP